MHIMFVMFAVCYRALQIAVVNGNSTVPLKLQTRVVVVDPTQYYVLQFLNVLNRKLIYLLLDQS
jgi:hypothetical protein